MLHVYAQCVCMGMCMYEGVYICTCMCMYEGVYAYVCVSVRVCEHLVTINDTKWLCIYLLYWCLCLLFLGTVWTYCHQVPKLGPDLLVASSAPFSL